MALYSFRCRDCGTSATSSAPIGAEVLVPFCGACNRPMKRDYRADAPRPAPVWQEHFNPSAGCVVSDRKQLAAKLRQKSDEMSEYTGMEHRYVPVDRADIPEFADVTDKRTVAGPSTIE